MFINGKTAQILIVPGSYSKTGLIGTLSSVTPSEKEISPKAAKLGVCSPLTQCPEKSIISRMKRRVQKQRELLSELLIILFILFCASVMDNIMFHKKQPDFICFYKTFIDFVDQVIDNPYLFKDFIFIFSSLQFIQDRDG